MKLKINYKKFITFFFGFIIQSALTIIALPELISIGDRWEKYAAYMSIFILGYAIYIWWKFKFTFLSPSFLFFIATYTLHLPLVILVAFNLKEYKVLENVVLYSYSESDCALAILYSCWFLFMYIVSYMFLKKRESVNKADEVNKNNFVDLNLARKIGYILLIISAPAMLYNNFIIIQIRMLVSYHDIYNINPTFFGISLGQFINLFLPSLFFILYSYSNNKKKFQLITLVIILYYLAFMVLTGAKITTIVTILSIMVMYNYYFKIKFSWKNIIFGYIFIRCLVAITSMRSDTGLVIHSSIVEQFLDGFMKSNPIIELINEIGGTILTPTLVILAVRLGGGHLGGMSYLFGPIGSVLKGLRIIDYFANKANMVVYLTDPARGEYINSKTYAMGGSVIGEWFLNFGWIGIIFIPILVICIIKFEKLLFGQNISILNRVMAYCFLVSLIMYSRQYITDLFWVAFYRYIICYILIQFILRFSMKRVKRG